MAVGAIAELSVPVCSPTICLLVICADGAGVIKVSGDLFDGYTGQRSEDWDWGVTVSSGVIAELTVIVKPPAIYLIVVGADGTGVLVASGDLGDGDVGEIAGNWSWNDLVVIGAQPKLAGTVIAPAIGFVIVGTNGAGVIGTRGDLFDGDVGEITSDWGRSELVVGSTQPKLARPIGSPTIGLIVV